MRKLNKYVLVAMNSKSTIEELKQNNEDSFFNMEDVRTGSYAIDERVYAAECSYKYANIMYILKISPHLKFFLDKVIEGYISVFLNASRETLEMYNNEINKKEK